MRLMMSLMRTFIAELISIPVRSSGSTPSCMNISREQYGANFNSGGDHPAEHDRNEFRKKALEDLPENELSCQQIELNSV